MLLSDLIRVKLLLLAFVCFGVQRSLALSGASPTTTNKNKPFAVNLKLSIKDDRREGFLSLIRSNQRKTLDLESESLQYVVGEDAETKNTFYLHEQVTSSQGFLDHRATDHTADWAAFKATDPFVGSIEMDSYLLEHSTSECEPRKEAFGVQVVLCIKPEVREDFLKCISANRAGSMQEPLCYQYAYGESDTTPNRFIFHEEYKSREGFEAHKQTPHFADWETFAATDPFTEPPVVNFFESHLLE